MSIQSLLCLSLITALLFAAMEIPVALSDRITPGQGRGKKSFISWVKKRILQNEGQFLLTMIICSIFSLVTVAVGSMEFLTSFSIRITGMIILSLGLTAILLVVTKLVPKFLLFIDSEKLFGILAVPSLIFLWILYPLTRPVLYLLNLSSGSMISEELKKLIRCRTKGSKEIRRGGDMADVENEKRLYRNALYFSKLKVRDCMVQRPEMEVIEISEDIARLKQKFIETQYSKIPVFRDHVDNIIGYVHSFDLFNQPESIGSCLRKISFVPETMEAKKLLSVMLRENKSIAVIVDEFGGTAGMITTEDIMEEIFGEIEDEYDKPGLFSQKINDRRFVFSGRLEIDHVNKFYGLNLKTSTSYETIAGFILYHHTTFPKANSIVRIGKYEFKMLRITRTTIELVEMKVAE